MPRPILTATLFALMTTATTASAQAPGPAGDEEALDCGVQYGLAARASGPGYDHVVYLANTCDFTLACSIRSKGTESDVALSAGQTRAIVVAQGEKTSDFRAQVQCFPVEDA